MVKTVITPVGASIFTNYMDKSKVVRTYPGLGRDYEAIVVQYEHLKDLPHQERNNSRYESDINYIKERIKYLWLAEAQEKASAELHTLSKIAEAEKTKLDVHLLATDTVLSVVACELVQEWLEGNGTLNGCKITCHYHFNSSIVKGLQVKEVNKFKKEGIPNLISMIGERKTKDTILNMSGGYKALVPFLTLIAQIEKCSLKYIYEDSNDLITIEKMPVNFDWGLIEAYTSEILDCSRITGKRKEEMESLGLIEYDRTPFTLTPLGDLMKAYINREDVPYQKTTMGYFIEYKIYEYYNKNNFADFFNVLLGYKLSDEEGQDMEDADLWMQNAEDEVVIAEIKPATFRAKNLGNKIKKILELTQQKSAHIKEFWIILYDYQNQPVNIDLDWCEKAINTEIRYLFGDIIFKVKKTAIPENVIDGNRNRMKYQEFMRASTLDIQDIYSTQNKKN
jgi:CRISPR/Cas system-associated protein Csm6